MVSKVLVIGDVMIDRYIYGKVKRISPEAPVPVILGAEKKSVLGGAANVALNVKAAGSDAALMSVIGSDAGGEEFVNLLKQNEIDSEFVLHDESRRTTLKTRFIAENGQQLLREDEEVTTDISDAVEKQMIQLLADHIDQFDVVLLSDYCKGVLSASFTQKVIQIANDHKKKVLIDVKDTDIHKYDNAYLLKPNQKEIGNLTGMPVSTVQEIAAAAEALRKQCKCAYILVTMGGNGMLLTGSAGYKVFPSAKVEVYDVTGAGDTAIAYLASEIADGSDLVKAIGVANIAAGIQVAKRGTSKVSRSEVDNYINNKNPEEWHHKVIPYEKASKIRAENPEKKIVFTNGCFDILHIGHLRYLRKASEMGDLLVIGLNSDASVRRLKGSSRPINNSEERSEMLAALPFVDYIVEFDQDTPYELIKKVQPDVLVKGADYKKKENVVGWDIVENRGGTVKLIDYVAGKSTTNIINKINHEKEKK